MLFTGLLSDYVLMIYCIVWKSVWNIVMLSETVRLSYAVLCLNLSGPSDMEIIHKAQSRHKAMCHFPDGPLGLPLRLFFWNSNRLNWSGWGMMQSSGAIPYIFHLLVRSTLHCIHWAPHTCWACSVVHSIMGVPVEHGDKCDDRGERFFFLEWVDLSLMTVEV